MWDTTEDCGKDASHCFCISYQHLYNSTTHQHILSCWWDVHLYWCVYLAEWPCESTPLTPLWLGAPTGKAGRLCCLDLRPCCTTILAVITNSSRRQLQNILKLGHRITTEHGTVELGGGTIREAAASNPGWQQSFFQLLVSKWSQWWCNQSGSKREQNDVVGRLTLDVLNLTFISGQT